MTHRSFRTAVTVVSVVLAGLAAGSCDGDDEATTTTSTVVPPGVGAPAPGGGLTVAEAVETDSREPLLVKGSLFVDPDGTVLLCSGLAESFPPQCAEPSLTVDGVDLAEFDLEEEQGVRWSDAGVALLGQVEDGRIVVDETTLAN